ncbi:MFS transporter [Salinigranum salinum]|uniref:MFS transporter n=1 Tax=Salinigranum salinum TaxID=1364937 RepID=UPI001260DE88|nr:MFS transporter [Salinigranum salinum]
MVLGTDRRVLTLGIARMADALGNSFLIVVLPLFIASGRVSLAGIAGVRLGVGPVSFLVTESLLIGVVLSLFGFLNSFSQPFTGRLSDRTGRRRVYILFGLGLLAVASAAYLVVTSYWLVLVLRALQGLAAGFTIPSTVALVNELATSDDRGGNFGVFNTLRLIGFGFGPIVAGVVIETVSVDAAFAVAVVGALVSFLLVVILVEDPERTEASAADDLSVAVRGEGSFLDPVFALGIGTFCMAIGIALFATLEGQVNERLSQGTFLFGVQFGAVVIANVVFQIPVGRASDRVGRRPFLLAGFLLLIPSVAAQGFVTDSLLMVVARFVQGAAVAMVFAPSLALAGDLAGEGESGTTLSVLTMAFGLGVAFGPLLSGFLERFGFAVPFVFGAVLAVLAFVITYSQVDETVTDARGLRRPIPQDD